MGEYATEAAERQRMAYTLRLAGLTYAEIAAYEHNGEPLYSSPAAAYRARKTYAASLEDGESKTEQHALELHRFDALQRAMWRKAIGGDIAAAKVVLKILESRERLLGLKGYSPAPGEDDPLDVLARRRAAKEAM